MTDLIHFPPVEKHLIRSRHVAQTYEIRVARPPRRPSETAPLPVVYVTDGNLVFNMFREISSMLQVLGIHPFPSFILVGIGYPSDSQFAGVFLRMRDLNCAFNPQVDKRAARPLFPIEGVLLAEEGTRDHGGAEEFQRFIGEELIPFIEEKYAVIPGDRTYFGHSGGGFFGLYTLFTQSHFFRNYIISSPGLTHSGEMKLPPGFQYDNKQPGGRDDYGFPMARDFIASGKTLQGTTLYMSVGTEEDFQPAYMGAELTATFYRMAALLKKAAIPGLRLVAEAIPGETHMSVLPVAFMHGVQAVFGRRQIAELR
jgi:uncharacterized protein